MGDVIKLKRPRDKHLRGLARDSYTDAVKSVGKPRAVVIIAMGSDGKFASRAVYDIDSIQEFDVYARAEALMNQYKQACIAD
jgi:hypothetical protein